MPYTKFAFSPGVYKDDSPLDAEGYFIDSDKIRFVRGKAQTIGGWERAGTGTLTGVCRGVWAWADTGRTPFAAFGTHLRLHAMDADGALYDITPIIARGELTNPFSTTNASAVVTVAHAAHGLVAGQKVSFSNAAPVGGLTIAGAYTVTEVLDADGYTITHTAAASSTAGPGGGAVVDYEYALAPGQLDGLGGLGFGTGGYGSGPYGSPAGGHTLYPRTWSLDNWGQNLVAAPRGGTIFEWAPNTAGPELLTNGGFSADTGWSIGSGWSVAVGALTASVASGSVEQPFAAARGAWHLLDFDIIAATAGSVRPYWGTTPIGASISTTGTYKRVFFCGAGGTQKLKFAASAFSGSLTNASLKTLTTAHLIDGAPSAVTSIFVTAERMLVACGCADFNANFDPLRLAWSDQENNQIWTADPANLAGSWTLSQGTRIVRGLAGRGENLIFTDTAVYAMRYVPDPNIVYRFDLIGTGCGLMGPNAVVQVSGAFFWLTPGGEFYMYDGGAPRPLQSTVRRYVADYLSWVQQDKVYAFAHAAWGEVWWLYPDKRDGNECSRYASYNYLENTWAVGTFDRTAWADAGVFQYPLAADTAGRVWFQEKDYADDGNPRTWSLSTAFFDIGDGDAHMHILGAYPDAEDLQGGYKLRIATKHKNQQGEVTRSFGPYNVTGATGKVSMRAVGQHAQVRWDGFDAPSFFRMGAFRLDMKPSGRRR
ncbi:MAG: hypothetical protein JNK21_10925 [Rhodospirillaceae bacterium]|nr:hypothetical protein [Rhodospirillaceae bacterium]